MKNVCLALASILVIGLLTAFSIRDIQGVEFYDFIPSNNPNYQLLEHDGQNYFCYNSVQVGKLHERRFVAGNDVLYFTRMYYPTSSSLEITNQNDQVLMHGHFSDTQSNFYFGRNDQYSKADEGSDVYIYKGDQLILRTELILDDVYGNRINLEYSVYDPNLRYLKLLAIESTIRNYENDPQIKFGKKLTGSRKSRY